MSDEPDIWKKETAGIQPLASRQKKKMVPLPPSQPSAKRTDAGRAPGLQEAPSPAAAASLTPLIMGQWTDMDAGTLRRIKRSQMAIGATLDLHGMKQAQALPALEAFIHNAVSRGHKLVLVITGKGGLNNPGVLKTNLPTWLNQPHLRPWIIACGPANVEHGGTGAFYVLLRKKTL